MEGLLLILRIVLVVAAVVVISSCSRRQTMEITESMADSYLESQRDGVIVSRQARLLESRACDPFRQAFAEEGHRFPSALSGGFHLALARVRDAAIAAGCWRGQSPQAGQTSLEARPLKVQEAQGSNAYRWKNEQGQWVLADEPPPPGTDFEVIPLRKLK